MLVSLVGLATAVVKLETVGSVVSSTIVSEAVTMLPDLSM